MSSTSSIEWTDATWNPTRGCTKVSAGCAHCYAEDFAERFRGVPGHAYEHGFDPRLAPGMLDEPLRWKKPRRIFVNSMSDLFHEAFPEDYLEEVCQVMAAAPRHTFQVLTKRPERLRALLGCRLSFAAALPHVWWGVSVEDRRHGVPRIKVLQETPARVRFLSAEPLLEALGPLELGGIDLVIVGGERGPRARLCFKPWVTEIRDACRSQRVAFFFKQWGGKRLHLTGRQLDGRSHDEMPPARPPPGEG